VRVLLLHDRVEPGAPPDQLDTLAQAEAIAAELGSHQLLVRAWGDDTPALLGEADLVVNLVESLDGVGSRAHLAPALFEAAGVPYTGSSAAAMALTTDKVLTRQFLAARGLRVAEPWRADAPADHLWIAKSRWEDASLGLEDDCVARTADVPAAVARLEARVGGEVLVERYVDGREVNVGILETPSGLRVLPPAEIRFDFPPGKPRIVGYRAKWDDSSEESRGTVRDFDHAGLPVELLGELSLRAFRACGLRGYGRVDWRVPAEGEPVALEVNANPCLAPDAGFAAAAARAGMSMGDLVAAIVASALAR
jgi:D-alanine-D-alanine ligase